MGRARNRVGGFTLSWIGLGALALVGAGVMGAGPFLWGSGPGWGGGAWGEPGASREATAAGLAAAPDTGNGDGGEPGGLANDPRVRAFLEAYGEFVDSVSFTDDDAVFMIRGAPVYFQEGRMLAEGHLRDAESYDPLFYAYSLEPLREALPLTGMPVYSTDLVERLFGSTEPQIRTHGSSATFLGRKVFVNTFCLDSLRKVEADVRAAAADDPAVAAWVSGLDVAYSFINREITGSDTRSYHSWGLAIDLVPASFRGRPVYWRWSRVLDSEWYRIPPERRWSPPEAVIEAFEAHGFVWGGKWAHFDAMHFEYRPAIILFNRMASGGPS